MAILKYCYVDITASTDAAALFSKYDALLRSLRLRFPSITFVAATVPLTTSAAVPGWTRKVWEVNLRRALHLYDVQDADNFKRNEPFDARRKPIPHKKIQCLMNVCPDALIAERKSAS